MNHTKEPWEYLEPENWCGLAGLIRSVGGGDQIAKVEIAGWRPKSIGRVNGQRIVTCVNALAGINPEAVGDLLEACKYGLGNLETVIALLDRIQESDNGYFGLDWRRGYEFEATRDRLKAAIAKAKEPS